MREQTPRAVEYSLFWFLVTCGVFAFAWGLIVYYAMPGTTLQKAPLLFQAFGVAAVWIVGPVCTMLWDELRRG